MDVTQTSGFFSRVLPAFWKETLFLRGFSFWKIPLLFYVRPRVLALDSHHTVVRLKLRRRTRNHVGTMYLAAMVAGADVASALMAIHQVRLAGEEVVPIFADLSAQFYRRADGDVHFTCNQGAVVADMVREVLSSDERVTRKITVYATVPSKGGDEPVAEFHMGLSLKKKRKA